MGGGKPVAAMSLLLILNQARWYRSGKDFSSISDVDAERLCTDQLYFAVHWRHG